MNLMLMPLPKRVEFLVRDALLDELQTKTLDELTNEIYTDLVKINKDDSFSNKRFQNLLIKIHTKEELLNVISSFLSRMKGISVPKKTEVDIAGGALCGGVCAAILISFGCGLASSAVYNLIQEWWRDEDDEDECNPEDVCANVIGYEVEFGGLRFCYQICVDINGQKIDEWEVPCEEASR